MDAEEKTAINTSVGAGWALVEYSPSTARLVKALDKLTLEARDKYNYHEKYRYIWENLPIIYRLENNNFQQQLDCNTLYFSQFKLDLLVTYLCMYGYKKVGQYCGILVYERVRQPDPHKLRQYLLDGGEELQYLKYALGSHRHCPPSFEKYDFEQYIEDIKNKDNVYLCRFELSHNCTRELPVNITEGPVDYGLDYREKYVDEQEQKQLIGEIQKQMVRLEIELVKKDVA